MLIIILFVFLAVFSLSWFVLYGRMVASDKIQSRLMDISSQVTIDHTSDEHQGVMLSRMATFISDKVIGVTGSMMPDRMNTKLGKKMSEAGLTPKVTIREWRLITVLVGAVLPVVIAQVMLLTGASIIRSFALALAFSMISQIFLQYYLILKSRKRRAKIVAELPDILDLITVSVEAGLSFDGAIDRVATESEGPLATEFSLTLKELRMGKTRRDALRRMSDRCNVADLTALVGSIIQADELGVAIGKILRIQSEQMRERRKQRAREKSMKAPVKMLFPLLFFIFPSIIIVLLGPALIRLMEVFG